MLAAGLTAATAPPVSGTGGAAPVRNPGISLLSQADLPPPPEWRGRVRLLRHTMTGIPGRSIQATTLLFTPPGTPPVGGWPVVAWAHGTLTLGQKTCAPSRSADFDGGLTRDGFKSDYAYQIGRFVNAGYAVVAPDYEGLGDAAPEPLPYYNAASQARSLLAGLRAARRAEPSLSSRFAAVGHSEGGHPVLGLETYASEAPELVQVATVAIAPFTSIEASVSGYVAQAKSAKDPAKRHGAVVNRNFYGIEMLAAVRAVKPSFPASAIMGNDLAKIVPKVLSQCSVGAIKTIDAAILAKGDARFDGLKPDWAANPDVRRFLQANDPAVEPDLKLRRLTLITQGTADPFVAEPLDRALAHRFSASGTPLTYRVYPGADHFTVIRRGEDDVLSFLRERFRLSRRGGS